LTVLMAQDEGKLSIDDSPKKYLSYFHMADPETDKNIKIRDLMRHASGLNRTDLAMMTGKFNRQQLIQVAGQAKPTAKLGEKFQYQNIMFGAVGEIAAAVEKLPYERLVTERVFQPLGMSNSTMSLKQMQKARDFSYGYSYNFDTKQTERVPFRDIDEIAPAGAINSSARDMAEWLRFVMNGGEANGKRLLSQAGYDEWTKPQMKIAAGADYGFGWFLQDWNGLKVVQHGGNIDGFNSLVAMIPEKKLGFVMLTNVGASSLGADLMPIVWENILGKPAPVESEKLPLITMQKMIGKYRLEAASLDVDVKVDGDYMVMTLPGQPPYTLKRTAPRTFKPEGLPDGFGVKFSPETGDATELALSQPGAPISKLYRILPDGSLAKPAGAEPASAPKADPTITVAELRDKVITALGGETAIRKVNSRVANFDISLDNQGVRGHGTSWTKAPGKAATETVLTALGKKIASGWEYFDGTSGEQIWTFAPADRYTGKRLADARRNADLYAGLDWNQFKKVTVVGVKKIGDEDAYQVRFEVNDGTDYTEYFSTRTFLLLRHNGVEVSSTSSQRIPFTVTYSDYRSVDGLMLPFKTVANSIAQGDVVTTVRSIKQNVKIDDRVFAARKVK
ncbi:MAG TPA: serine hydrolase domain-containing protein, partial [Pyrinomonadaceae bacterium]|nr:serine hydrolase domain-containing protein [Pyrinomonadaceae bacterium]